MARYSCTICYKFAAPNFRCVLRHIGSVHSFEPNFYITCGIDECPRTYSSYRSFRKHMLKSHMNTLEEESTETHSNMSISNSGQSLEYVDQPVQQCSIKPKLYENVLFLLKAKEERRISQRALDGLVDDITEFFRTQTYVLGAELKECLEKMNYSIDVITTIEEVIKKKASCSLFDGLHTAYLQRKYYADNFSFMLITSALW